MHFQLPGFGLAKLGVLPVAPGVCGRPGSVFRQVSRRIQQPVASARAPSSRPSRASPGAGPLDPEFDME
eukprot:7041671-Lingulodinium_polyedra.AAC.1